MAKDRRFPSAMNNVGEPENMSPINELTNRSDSKPPVVEINKPLETEDPLEIREPGSVTLI
jgi:hypothetical protein